MLACLQYKDGRGLGSVAQLLHHLVREVVCWEDMKLPLEVEKAWRVFFQLQDKEMR